MADRPFSFDFWPPEADPTKRRLGATPASTPSARRADETTRIARAATDKDTAARAAKVAKLKAARMAKEAEDAAAKAAEPVAKPKRARKAAT